MIIRFYLFLSQGKLNALKFVLISIGFLFGREGWERGEKGWGVGERRGDISIPLIQLNRENDFDFVYVRF